MAFGGEFSDDPFDQKNRNGKDQKPDDCNGDNDETNHNEFLFLLIFGQVLYDENHSTSIRDI